jgi:glutamine---fructose-6-phosphate transaminase (isomerizing)
MSLYSEIQEQPDSLRRLLQTQRSTVEQIATAIGDQDVRFVYVAARGTSENAARYSNYLWGMLNGLPVALAAPSMFTYYQRPPRLRGGFVVGISQSGRSPDIVSVLTEAKRQGCRTLAITNAIQSPLADTADFVLDIQAGEEYSVAATKTYSSELMAIAMISAAMSRDDSRWAELFAIPKSVHLALKEEEDIQESALHHRAISSCVVLGRGFSYATAYEWALKLKEVAQVEAQAYSSADFLHGPIATVDGNFPILAVIPVGAVYASMMEVVEKLRTRSAKIVVLSDDSAARSMAQTGLRFPAGVPEWLNALVSIIPSQLFSYHLALAKGLDPAAPRGIHKITETI